MSNTTFTQLKNTLASLMLALAVFLPISGTVQAKPEKSTQTQQVIETVNINKADADELAEILKGVGEKKALAIVAYREANGNFKTVEELANVKGIGEKTVAKNKSKIRI